MTKKSYWGPLHRIQGQQSIIKCTTLETYAKQGKPNNKLVIYGPQCETLQFFDYLGGGGSPVVAVRYTNKYVHIASRLSFHLACLIFRSTISITHVHVYYCISINGLTHGLISY